ncbi:Bug family tripartite tricarboxylate transporter substrate binding protein [Paracraurococcus ruber]|uniref:Twin-arginine translocation pathway signal protein n=1 Tax=Paracraurococcus ruber TaxID=77675 RepID=A0ABS1D333_9PROT|nr:tripartite tricarboxylate transporter substrate binding protein [Paracraurococcus ruber]MBK1660961.1 twin-arginine translocation pathway signal protein [Paracraurococcus ruber]TDG26637.1 tripartite tricarboxylate transporter substrate binding protein [Paracraurococcus ruber]
MTTRRSLLLAAPLVPLAAPAVFQGALAQSAGDWPNRPVRVVIPWPPGGSTDVLARIVSEQLSAKLGQPFVLENRPGASGNIGMEAIAKAAPDGYTQGPATVANLSISQFLYAKLPFDPEKDFSVISMHWELPNVVVAPAQYTPPNTLREFIDWAKARRNGVSFGSPGVGTTAHLSGALFCDRERIDGQHVPFRGAAQIIPAMLSGDLTFAIDNLASYIPVIAEGRLKAYAVTSPARWPTLPNIPTMAEAGVRDFVVTSWCTWVGPAGMPRPIMDKVNAALREIAADPAVQQRFQQTGARCLWSTPEDAVAHAARQRPMFAEMVKISGARME